jgi:hypothetical protein
MISESVVIDRLIDPVFAAFAELENWPIVLPDVLGVETLYDSGRHQEFLMTVERPNGAETIRGIRFCKTNERIELFQPQPPPGFRRMSGKWTFESNRRSTTVTADRSFELDLPPSISSEQKTNAYDTARQKLSGYLRKNLELFRASLEIGT